MDSFSVRTKILMGSGMEKLAEKLHRVFLVTDKFMAESGKTSYVTDRLDSPPCTGPGPHAHLL